MDCHHSVDHQVVAKQKRKELKTELKVKNISIFKDGKIPKIFLVYNICVDKSFSFWLENREIRFLCTML